MWNVLSKLVGISSSSTPSSNSSSSMSNLSQQADALFKTPKQCEAARHSCNANHRWRLSSFGSAAGGTSSDDGHHSQARQEQSQKQREKTSLERAQSMSAMMVIPGTAATTPPVAKASVHAYANIKQPNEYSDWELSDVKWCDGSLYRRTEVLGRGKYSNVYGVVRKTDGRVYAVKSLKPNRSKRVKREIHILRNLRAGPSIIEFYGAFIDAYTNEPALIFRRINNVDWRDLYPSMTMEDVRCYAFQLFRALDFAHSKGIMHRDVKPQNILYDPTTRELRLIDWGLADFYFPGLEYNLRVASRYYKPPEILLGYRRYDYSFDMWSAGCVVAGMMFRVEVMFRGSCDEDQLRAIASVLGGAELRAYARKYQINLTPGIISVVRENRTKRADFSSFLTLITSNAVERAALDLIDNLLCYDHADRITARQALQHPYFTGLSFEDPTSTLALPSSAET
ncbi:hypothetical protein HDU90_006366 [Geranomyces variabilis]|nr:hypothetical protein HDU90_006366 [Geranomyces variabilis]